MRNKTIILMLFLLLLCGVLWFVHNPPPLPQPETAAPETVELVQSASTSTVPSATAETGFSKVPFFTGPLPDLSVNSGSGGPFREWVATKELSKLLADKEGSYTNLNDLFRGDGTFSVDLRSEWATRYFFPNRRLPGLRVRIIRNPETGEYEPAGGTLILPGGSLEAGYEVNPSTDENKATLQWKKSF